MEMASNLGYAIIDRLLRRVQSNTMDKARDFSEIELTILERIFTICVNLLQEPWQNVVQTSPRLERIETTTACTDYISERDNCNCNAQY